jgi:hypothetical protein
LVNSAPDFTVGPGGINISGLKTVIDDATKTLTIGMVYSEVNGTGDIPQMRRILKEIGYLYVAFSQPTGGGHVNVLMGFSPATFEAIDPDPKVRRIPRADRFYFSRFPALVGWRETANFSDYQ